MASFLVCGGRDSKGESENSPVDCFPTVGESHKAKTRPVGMWIGFDLYP